jgi:hypothetical protein
MRVLTILQRRCPHKGFVYAQARFAEQDGPDRIEVSLRPRKGSRPICSGCGQPSPG